MPPRPAGSSTFFLRGEQMVLMPQRALWWPGRETLVVADVHLGKSETYRALGVPIPAGIGEESLARLAALTAVTGARRLVILGDLVHSAAALSAPVRSAVAAVRSDLPERVVLVRGNHEAAIERLPAEWAVEEVDAPLDAEPFALLHHPAGVRGRYALAGHLHPTFAVAAIGSTGAGGGLRCPCFHFGPRIGVLPAFSAFTRGVPMLIEQGDSVFVIAEGEIIAIEAGGSESSEST